jgi:small nuclear ribonucleoprotein (snRNP)-like protein
MEKAQAEDYLSTLLNKNLRITISDTRMFHGQFKCTDSVCLPSHHSLIPTLFTQTLIFDTNKASLKDRNVILAHTFEYRAPPPPKLKDLEEKGNIKLDMTSRYLGLVVVPGEHIKKIELEEFASQIKGKGRLEERKER